MTKINFQGREDQNSFVKGENCEFFEEKNLAKEKLRRRENP